MYTTYKILSGCATKEYMDKTLEQLVEDYKNTECMNKKNKIVSSMFCKVYPMILKVQEKYYSVTNEQKVEIAMYHLVRSIKRYKGGKTKFSTFFYVHLSNMMKTFLTSENSLKRAAFQNIVRDNENILQWYTQNTPDKALEHSDRFFLDNLDMSADFSKDEKEYCRCVMCGYTQNKELYKRMSCITQLEKTVTNPININDCTKEDKLSLYSKWEEEQKKIENLKKRKISLIKQSVKNKLKAQGIISFC